jgi:hypothetical protein
MMQIYSKRNIVAFIFFSVLLPPRMSIRKNIVQSDKAGIASAFLCTIHCLIIPVLLLVRAPLANNTQLPEWWSRLDYVFLLISFLAVYHSAAHTRRKEIKVALWIFWAILAISIIFEATLHNMAYFASAGLIATHLVNLRQSRKAVA